MVFEFNNDIPIYVQLANELKQKIISGKIKSGERLESVRELALKNKVNPNTMQRALLELEDLKLIFTERTNGKFVTLDQSVIDSYKNEYAFSLSKKYLEDMKAIGLAKTDIIEIIKNLRE